MKRTKRIGSALMVLILLCSLCIGIPFSAAATGEDITAAAQGTYTQSETPQDITIRLTVTGLTVPYCTFGIDGGVTLPDGFAVKSYSTSNTAQAINAGDYDPNDGTLNYATTDTEDTIPAETYYDLVVTAPGGAFGLFTVTFSDVTVSKTYGTVELVKKGSVTASFAIASSAVGPYTVTYPQGWYGEFNANGDYIVTFSDAVAMQTGLLLVYADFAEDAQGICAFKGYYGEDGSVFKANQRILPKACITGNFEVKPLFFTAEQMTPNGIGLTGAGTEDDPYQIKSELELLKLMAVGSLCLANNPFFGTGIYYSLKNDIVFHTPLGMEIGYLDGGAPDANGNTMFTKNQGRISISMLGYGFLVQDGQSLGSAMYACNPFFHGTFDGKNHTISGLNSFLDEPTSYQNSDDPVPLNAIGLFGFCDGTIKNLTVETSDSGINTNRLYAAILVAASKGGSPTLENCDAKGKITVSSLNSKLKTGTQHKPSVGLVVGGSVKEMINCTAEGEVYYHVDVSSNTSRGMTISIGGVAGAMQSNCTVANCTNKAKLDVSISCTNTTAHKLNVGGVVGDGNTGTIQCSANILEGDKTISVTAADTLAMNVGGVSGTVKALTGCYNVGSVTATNSGNDNIGSFTGTTATKGSICSCFSYSNILLYGALGKNATVSYSYILGTATGSEDETAAVKVLSAADFASHELAAKLNAHLPEESGKCFVLTENAQYPTLFNKADVSVVTFDLNDGNAAENRYVLKNTIIAEPEAPTWDGHIFKGWYPVTNGEMGSEAYDFNALITGDL